MLIRIKVEKQNKKTMPKLKDYPNQEIITEEKPIPKKDQPAKKLTATEQAQVDQFLAKFGFKKKADD